MIFKPILKMTKNLKSSARFSKTLVKRKFQKFMAKLTRIMTTHTPF